MTKPIKLTEESFDIMEPDEYYWENGHILAFNERFDEDNIKLNQLKQQILENQKIVNTIIKHYYTGIKKIQNDSTVSTNSRSYLISTVRYIEDLIKSITGKDITGI